MGRILNCCTGSKIGLSAMTGREVVFDAPSTRLLSLQRILPAALKFLRVGLFPSCLKWTGHGEPEQALIEVPSVARPSQI